MPTRSSVSATFVDPGGMRVDAESASGFPVRFDTLSSAEGGAGASPTETILAALAACTAMDVASILRKKRQPFARLPDRRSPPTRQTSTRRSSPAITVEHQLSGPMTAEAVRRSVELSATAYCPVSAMLSASVRIEHRYRIRRDGEAQEEAAVVVVTGPDALRAAGRAATG